jgi:poly [ADP-ribose] polymerase 2/3/4
MMQPDVSIPAGDTGINNATLFFNEYICYDTSQVRLRYLFRVKIR